MWLFIRLQGQVSEVINVMQDNIGKVLDRGDKLEDLQDKSGGVICLFAVKVM